MCDTVEKIDRTLLMLLVYFLMF